MSTGIIDGNVQGLYLVSLTLDPASVATITAAEQDFTVPGVRATDVIVNVSMQAAQTGLGIGNARVKAAGTVSVVFVNPTAAAIDATARVFQLVIARPDATLLGGLPQ